jgi:hypothetical protein
MHRKESHGPLIQASLNSDLPSWGCSEQIQTYPCDLVRKKSACNDSKVYDQHEELTHRSKDRDMSQYKYLFTTPRSPIIGQCP